MYRWVTLLVWAQCACIPTQDPTEGEAAADASADAGDGADAAVRPAPADPAHAALTRRCGPEGVDELLVVLSAEPGCDGAADTRLELVVGRPVALPGELVIGEGVTGRAFVGGEAMAIVSGVVTVVDAAGAEGRYHLTLEDGSVQASDFTASACGGVACELPEDGGCAGTYVVTAWSLDIPAFSNFALNDAVERNLADGDLLLDLIVAEEEPVAVVRDTVIAPNGARVPDPAVPPGVPLQVARDGDALRTAQPGEARALVGPFRLTPDDPHFYAPAVDLHLVLAELSGAFEADCQSFEGHLDGAFADRPMFTIPAAYDADTDGDGALDGWHILSTLTAVRIDD